MEVVQIAAVIGGWVQDGHWTVTACAVGVALAVLLLQQYVVAAPQRKLPPGPRGWPILGNVPQMGAQPHRALKALHKKYGHILYVRLGNVPTVVVDSPELVAEVMKVQDSVFSSRPYMTFTRLVAYDAHDFAMAPYGPHWRHMRRICVHELLTPKRLESTARERSEEIACTVGKVLDAANRGASALDMRGLLAGTSMTVMCRMILGRRDFSAGGGSTRDFHHITEEIFRLMGAFVLRDFVPWLGWLDVKGYERDMRKLRIELDEMLDEIIQEHRDLASGKLPGGVPNNFISTLLELPGENGAPNLDEKSIKAITFDMIAGGTDTSAVTNEWVMAEVLRNPEVQRKLQEEIDAVVGRDRNVTESDLVNLPFLMCVVKESLRMHPAAAFGIPRESLCDTTLNGFHVAKGTRVLVNIFSLGLSAEVWTDPYTFNPDRWRHENLTSLNDPAIRMIVFGYGRRQCPGYYLGTTMVLFTLASLFHGFHWSLPPGVTPETLDMEDNYVFMVPPRTRLRAVATPRLAPHLYAQ